MLPQILPVHPPPLANGSGFLRQRQVWDIVIPHADIADVDVLELFAGKACLEDPQRV